MHAMPHSSPKPWLQLEGHKAEIRGPALRLVDGSEAKARGRVYPWPDGNIFRARVDWLDGSEREIGSIEIDLAYSAAGLMGLAGNVGLENHLGPTKGQVLLDAMSNAWGVNPRDMRILGRVYTFTMTSGVVDAVAMDVLAHSMALVQAHLHEHSGSMDLVHFVVDASCWLSQHRGPSEFNRQHDQELHEQAQLQQLIEGAGCALLGSRQDTATPYLVPRSLTTSARLGNARL